ncbi:hypothetical protein TEA_005295 [Camellia sinensis var. sinensis]|uniref:Uncharacterized protein n=1 Tax=Camellia sinensis var. sinensis TaxID=542762 RepID=A0A4S4DTT0_CAMSN|nr:hypothetical protein TEA_005295 [Camellia sinensis var. sinensis]
MDRFILTKGFPLMLVLAVEAAMLQLLYGQRISSVVFLLQKRNSKNGQVRLAQMFCSFSLREQPIVLVEVSKDNCAYAGKFNKTSSRNEVTRSDAITAILCIESSMTASAIVDSVGNALHSNFTDNPDQESYRFGPGPVSSSYLSLLVVQFLDSSAATSAYIENKWCCWNGSSAPSIILGYSVWKDDTGNLKFPFEFPCSVIKRSFGPQTAVRYLKSPKVEVQKIGVGNL